MKVRFKKVHRDAIVPYRGSEHAAGYDLCAVEVRRGSGYVEYKTGIAVEIPEGHCGLLFPRSSISKTQHFLSNGVGLCDADFRGEITFRFRVYNPQQPAYKLGDRIGQIVIVPYPQIEFEEAEELSETVRGTGGYGSTGR